MYEPVSETLGPQPQKSRIHIRSPNKGPRFLNQVPTVEVISIRLRPDLVASFVPCVVGLCLPTIDSRVAPLHGSPERKPRTNPPRHLFKDSLMGRITAGSGPSVPQRAFSAREGMVSGVRLQALTGSCSFPKGPKDPIIRYLGLG